MMNAMIRNMSVEEREEMMLQMMPEMMKRVDVKIMLPNTLKTLGKMISLYGVYELISKLLNEKELIRKLSDKLKELKEKMPDMMQKMMPMMKPFMKKFMPKMMGNMMPMMSGMMKEMNKDGDCMMIDMIDEKPEMKERMSEMMFENCPRMAGKVIPEEKGEEFIEKMKETVLINKN